MHVQTKLAWVWFFFLFLLLRIFHEFFSLRSFRKQAIGNKMYYKIKICFQLDRLAQFRFFRVHSNWRHLFFTAITTNTITTATTPLRIPQFQLFQRPPPPEIRASLADPTQRSKIVGSAHFHLPIAHRQTNRQMSRCPQRSSYMAEYRKRGEERKTGCTTYSYESSSIEFFSQKFTFRRMKTIRAVVNSSNFEHRKIINIASIKKLINSNKTRLYKRKSFIHAQSPSTLCRNCFRFRLWSSFSSSHKPVSCGCSRAGPGQTSPIHPHNDDYSIWTACPRFVKFRTQSFVHILFSLPLAPLCCSVRFSSSPTAAALIHLNSPCPSVSLCVCGCMSVVWPGLESSLVFFVSIPVGCGRWEEPTPVFD